MQCTKHSFETAADLCEACGNPMCQKCLVYPHGTRKPPFCITCALVVSGVKHGAVTPLSRKEIKRRRKEFVVTPISVRQETTPVPAPIRANPDRQIEWCA